MEYEEQELETEQLGSSLELRLQRFEVCGANRGGAARPRGPCGEDRGGAKLKLKWLSAVVRCPRFRWWIGSLRCHRSKMWWGCLAHVRGLVLRSWMEDVVTVRPRVMAMDLVADPVAMGLVGAEATVVDLMTVVALALAVMVQVVVAQVAMAQVMGLGLALMATVPMAVAMVQVVATAPVASDLLMAMAGLVRVALPSRAEQWIWVAPLDDMLLMAKVESSGPSEPAVPMGPTAMGPMVEGPMVVALEGPTAMVRTATEGLMAMAAMATGQMALAAMAGRERVAKGKARATYP